VNETERALVTLQDLLDNSIFTSRIDFALEVAIEALREQVERSKGCEYCLLGLEIAYNAESKHINSKESYICLDGNILEADLYTEYMAVEVRYCPMCGKRLEVEP
jgi:hypothetical protein